MSSLNSWGEIFTGSLQNIWFGISSFLPRLIIAVIVFIIGLIIAKIVYHAIVKVCETIKIDKLFEGSGIGEAMQKSGMRFSVGEFLGTLVKWLVLAVFLMFSLNFLELTQVAEFFKQVVTQYLPRVMVASLILVIAAIVADIARKIILGSAHAMDIKSANMLASIAKYSIWIFALIISLSELGIAAAFMQIFFTGVVAMLAIAGGISFGLGGKDWAQKKLEKIDHDLS